MKRILSILGCAAIGIVASFAQQAGTNAVVPAPANAAAAPDSSNEPDIKELLKLPEFTNDTGMVMVKISDALWAGKYEVTQEAFQKIAGNNPSEFQSGQRPVDSVSWSDARKFCEKLNDMENEKKMLPDGFVYTLPTQGQWESFSAGVELKDAVTGSGATRSGTSPVGSLGPNPKGLYDVRGNVCEWCLDPDDKPFRVARGAAWDTFIEVNLRPDFRWYANPDERKNSIGFRVVLAPKS